MAKNVIELDDLMLAKIKVVAKKNGLDTRKQDLVTLGLKIAVQFIEELDSLTFYNVTGGIEKQDHTY